MHVCWILAGCLALVGCRDDEPTGADGTGTTGSTGEDSTADGTEGGPIVEQEVVPLELAALPVEAECFELDVPPDERSVSPEGHLWLRQDEHTWRVIDPFGSDDVQVLPPGVTALQAWGHDRAFVIDQDALWDVQGEWPQPLAWPEALAVPTGMCGDPSSDANGFVLAEGLLHRDAGQWWHWTDPTDRPWTDVAWLARSAGACIGDQGDLWLAEADGAVWRITGDLATRVEPFDGADRAALVDGLGAAVVLDGDVLVGDVETIVHYTFEAGSASEVSSGGQALWIAAGGRLLRLADGEFMTATQDDAPVEPGEPGEPGELLAEAGGGVWTLTADQACHLRAAPPVRIEGVHNLQRLVDETVEIAVEVSTGASLEQATLDGEALTMEADGTLRYRAEPQAVAEGWHTLEVTASGGDGDTLRRVHFEQRRVGDLSWTGDVEPIFVEHCSGEACHGPGLADATRPDLSTYDAWIEREASIVDRVVNKGDMPPANARKDTWGLELQLLISEWFETGAAQGDMG